MVLTEGQLITKLKYRFGEKFPWLAGLCNNTELVLTDQPIITPDGTETVGYCHDTTITLRKDFVGNDFDVALGVFAHEVLHIVLMHTARYAHYKEQGMSNEWAMGYNILADLRINSMLRNEGIKLPEGCVDSGNINECLKQSGFKKAEGVSGTIGELVDVINADDLLSTDKAFNMFRSYYTIEERPKGRGRGNGGGGAKQWNGNDLGQGTKSAKEQEEDIQQKIVSGLVGSQEKGSGHGGMRRLFEKAYYQKKIDYGKIVKQSLCRDMQRVIDYNQPHKKSLELDFCPYLPRWNNQENKYHVAIGIDNSGSMSSETINKICGELFRLIERYPVSFDVFVCDDEISNVFMDVRKVEQLKKIKQISGCGGTSFSPVLERIEKMKHMKGKGRRDYKTLLYFSDGFGNNSELKEVKGLKVFWMIDDQGRKINFPFGKVYMIS